MCPASGEGDGRSTVSTQYEHASARRPRRLRHILVALERVEPAQRFLRPADLEFGAADIAVERKELEADDQLVILLRSCGETAHQLAVRAFLDRLAQRAPGGEPPLVMRAVRLEVPADHVGWRSVEEDQPQPLAVALGRILVVGLDPFLQLLLAARGEREGAPFE